MAQGGVGMEAIGNVVLIRYPPACRGSTFVTSYSEVSTKLAAATTPFRLIHDFRFARHVDLWALLNLQSEAFFADATAMANRGKVERVAFISGPISHWIRRSIELGLYLSPVQPARLFEHESEAVAWAAAESQRAPRPEQPRPH